ncbi:hypothetical protein [Kineococcus indalonis]|uniref:hypothetical protein n=1 Tax=Kineococcus indalonis TaxID=2696566 RepID=UPI00141236F6|nr:hypothetical protein [Kineococcus indalonis]NAZ85350.1 hypothetical protein [Kineococcus indalonis]
MSTARTWVDGTSTTTEPSAAAGRRRPRWTSRRRARPAGHGDGSLVVVPAGPSGPCCRALADSDAQAVRDDLARVIALAGRVHLVPAHDALARARTPA